MSFALSNMSIKVFIMGLDGQKKKYVSCWRRANNKNIKALSSLNFSSFIKGMKLRVKQKLQTHS